MRRPSLRCVCGLLLVLASVLVVHAAEPGQSPSPVWIKLAPVQDGPVSDTQAVLAFHPRRVMIKLRAEALERSTLSPAVRRGLAQGDPETGLPSLDAISRQAGLESIVRSTIEVQDADLDRLLGVSRWFRFVFPAGRDLPALVARYAADPAVESASLDYRAFPAAIPNDPSYPDQWGHNNTGQMKDYCWGCGGHDNGTPVGTPGFDAHAQAAWDRPQGYGNAGVVIAIIDSGVDKFHPDLRQVTGWDYGSGDSDPHDDSAQPGHGTACAGVAAAVANNSLGPAGIAGDCSIMPLKVANDAGDIFFSAVQNALYYAADNGANVASMSFGAAITSDPGTDDAIAYAHSKGVVQLAATGNENASTISYPAVHSLVIGVGAASPCDGRKRSSSNSADLNPGVSADPNGYTCDGERWWGSNYGSATPDAAGAVDVIAPTILPTTDISGSGGYTAGDYYQWFNGTSAATPYAAGVAALVAAAHPSWTPTQIRDQLAATATDVVNVESGSGWDRYSGYGLVNADAAVAGGGSSGPTYATLPYSTGFESGSLDASWTTTSTADGRVRLLTTNGPHTGSYHMTMDDSTSGGFSRNEAWLHLDLSAENDVDLVFWWKEFSDETHAEDGVYFSDDGGGSFVKVLDFDPGATTDNSWQRFQLDLDQLAAGAGLTLSSTFVVKFQQYDNYPMTSDGFAFDDISVDPVTGGGGGGGGSYATLPYSTGFESGSLDTYWTTTSTGDGRVRLLTTNGPRRGTYHMTMDDSTSGGFSRNEAWLHLDLAGHPRVDLTFWWKEFGDETHTEDGVYFSSDGGSSFVKVLDFDPAAVTDDTWQFYSLDVDQLAASAGLSLTSTFVIKFQQYDNYPMTSDGFAFDEVQVTAGPITAESEPNDDGASADGPMGDGTAVSGTIASSADDDWFYFDVKNAGTVEIVLDILGSADLDWYLYHESDLVTEVAKGYTTNDPESGTYNCSVARYFIRVDGYQGATSSYTLTINGAGVTALSSPGPLDAPEP